MSPHRPFSLPRMKVSPEAVPRIAGVVLKLAIAALVLASTMFAAGQDVHLSTPARYRSSVALGCVPVKAEQQGFMTGANSMYSTRV